MPLVADIIFKDYAFLIGTQLFAFYYRQTVLNWGSFRGSFLKCLLRFCGIGGFQSQQLFEYSDSSTAVASLNFNKKKVNLDTGESCVG
jgi:hypothetical protein